MSVDWLSADAFESQSTAFARAVCAFCGGLVGTVLDAASANVPVVS